MNFENEIVYVKNKEYVYVETINVDNDNVLDLSIFEIEEWTHLTKISKVFEDAVVNLDVEISLRPYIVNLDVEISLRPYINVSKDIKKGAYYLYYSPFCNWKGFNDLEYEMLEINDIYKVVFDLVREDKKRTINKFRRWIIDNYTNIQMHYENLLDNKINLFIPFS
jgi:hypothetical protein